MSTTIRIDDATKARIDNLAVQLRVRVGTVVSKAIDELERATFFDSMNSRYAELREEGPVWASISKEREIESGAMPDDLDE